MLWSELDLDAALWTIGKGCTKNGFLHGVPLSQPLWPCCAEFHVRGMQAKLATSPSDPGDLSELVVALECGSSDFFSGLSANPVVGEAADMIVAPIGNNAVRSNGKGQGAQIVNISGRERAAAREKFHTPAPLTPSR